MDSLTGCFRRDAPDVAVQRVHVAGTGSLCSFLEDLIDNGFAPSLSSLLQSGLAFPKGRVPPEGFESVCQQSPITVLEPKGPMGAVVRLQSPVLIPKMFNLQSGFRGLPSSGCLGAVRGGSWQHSSRALRASAQLQCQERPVTRPSVGWHQRHVLAMCSDARPLEAYFCRGPAVGASVP